MQGIKDFFVGLYDKAKAFVVENKLTLIVGAACLVAGGVIGRVTA